MKKFVVYITSYTGTMLPPKYIGSTSEDKILSGSYFGSVRSKKWKDIFNSEISNNKHLFSTKILSYHDTREEALAEELRLQILHNVVQSDDYFNESFARPNGYFGRSLVGKDSPTYGINPFERSIDKYGLDEAVSRKDAQYKKVSEKLKNKKQQSSVVENRRRKNIGKNRTIEQRQKLSDSHKLDLDKNLLIDLYVNQHLSKSDISKMLNCHRHTITNHLNYYGIKR